MKISCVIIDDERNALLLLEEYVSHVPWLDLKGKFINAKTALEYLNEHTTDLIFTDINMPKLSGIDMASMLPPDQKIIFTTAHQKHAIASFNFNVIDYLLKPISLERFLQSANKVKIHFKYPQPETNLPYFFIKHNKQTLKILFDDILYVEADKEYVKFHLMNDKKKIFYKRMKEVAALLPKTFVRIHHSYMVNMNRIDRIEENIIIIAEQSLPISLTYKKDVQEFLNNRLV